VAGRLDRQAYEVVVPLKPDVQARAVSDAKELAALMAAPFVAGVRRPRVGGWCVDLPEFCGERLAHFPNLSLEGDGALEAER
jgi:hypothetical protein